MFAWISSNLIWTEGAAVLAVLVVSTAISLVVSRKLLWIMLCFFIVVFFFFRNPYRDTSIADRIPGTILAPADGRIIELVEAGEVEAGYDKKLSTFLSPLDVHVTRSPVSATVRSISYSPGAHLCAFLPKSSELNERNDILFETQDGAMVLMRQIAGVLARRIVCWISEGEQVKAGQPVGMIKFGSRVDLFVSTPAAFSARVGDRVLAGESVIGNLYSENEANGGAEHAG